MTTIEQYIEATRHPGKFQGEPAWVPYFYEILMDGMADRDDDGIAYFRIQDEDINVFPELQGYDWAMLEETESGFVIGSLE